MTNQINTLLFALDQELAKARDETLSFKIRDASYEKAYNLARALENLGQEVKL